VLLGLAWHARFYVAIAKRQDKDTFMSFTVAGALTRLNASQRNPFLTTYGLMSAGQQLQRINELLDIWYVSDSWRGIRGVIVLTSVLGIVSLPAAYLRADKRITITTAGHEGCYYEIKPIEYQFQSGGPGYWDVSRGCFGVAIDLGDVAGIRQYQLTGNTTTLDSYAYKAVCRKRFNFITDTATVVVPDCYSALELSVRAMAAADANANELAKDLWNQAFIKLDSDLGQFQDGDEWPVMQLDPFLGMGSVPNLI